MVFAFSNYKSLFNDPSNFGRVTLSPKAKNGLDEVVARAKTVKLEVIIVIGHADRIEQAGDQDISLGRAGAAKEYLVSQGIPFDRIYVEGKGNREPLTKPGQCTGSMSEQVIECLEPDRRIDIEVIGTK